MMLYPTTANAALVWLLAGVFLLLLGVRQVSDALQRVLNGRMQQALTRLSKYPLAAFGIGIVGTGLMQSSSAMASLLVELVSAGLLPLGMAIVIVLGANVGSTLVVQLLAFHITDYSLEVLGVGAAIALFTHRSRVFGRPGRALFAFGLILLGLAAIGAAGQYFTLGHTAGNTTLFSKDALEKASLVLFVVGALLAVALNSSSASIGLILTLASQTALPSKAALALMLGANVGTTVLPMLASLSRGTLTGRRLALAHASTKLLGALLLLALLDPMADLLNRIGLSDPAEQVALSHMGFNLALAVIFVPFTSQLAHLMERLLPDKTDQTMVGSPSVCLLDPRALATPAVAQGLATREVLRMADIVTNMFELSIQAFDQRPSAIQKRIEEMEKELDELNTAIRGYLTQMDEEEMPEELARRDITLLTIIGDLEAIGDVITKRLMALARRRSRDQIQFSEEGGEDLRHYHEQIEEALQQVVAALAAHNPILATKFLARKEELKPIKRKLHLRHIRQLRADAPNSVASSAIYLDLLDALSDVLGHIFNIAYALQETKSLRSLRTGHFVAVKGTTTGQLNSAPLADLGKETGVLSSTISSLRNPVTGQVPQLEFSHSGQLNSAPLADLGKETGVLSSTTSSLQSVRTGQTAQLEFNNSGQLNSAPLADLGKETGVLSSTISSLRSPGTGQVPQLEFNNSGQLSAAPLSELGKKEPMMSLRYSQSRERDELPRPFNGLSSFRRNLPT
jgi:phosphate:Na+ symporter